MNVNKKVDLFPTVSVVLTTYNRGQFIRHTLDDILSQTLHRFELIICDDCSTDETPDICREYQRLDTRIKYLRNPTNVGMPQNLNIGIRASTGALVANLHDGHRYDARLLEMWSSALSARPSCAFVFNAYLSVGDDDRQILWRENLPSCMSGHHLLEQVFFRRWRFDSPVYGTVMARRSAYEDVGLFDPRFSYYADVDMWLRMAERFEVAYVSEPLIKIPNHVTMPRLFTFSLFAKRKLLERMFIEARVRHYSDRPLRLMYEALRHSFYSLYGRAFDTALHLRDINSLRWLAG